MDWVLPLEKSGQFEGKIWRCHCWLGRRETFCLPRLGPTWSPPGSSGRWGRAGMVCLCQSEWCCTRISRLARWWQDPAMLPAWRTKCLLQNANNPMQRKLRISRTTTLGKASLITYACSWPESAASKQFNVPCPNHILDVLIWKIIALEQLQKSFRCLFLTLQASGSRVVSSRYFFMMAKANFKFKFTKLDFIFENWKPFRYSWEILKSRLELYFF